LTNHNIFAIVVSNNHHGDLIPFFRGNLSTIFVEEKLRMDALLRRDAEEFYRWLSELLRVYQFRDRTRICYHDVSVTQCYAISTLVRIGYLTLNRLAAELCLDKSTASRVVDSLERKGYVNRYPDPDDGRAIRLEVTSEGHELHLRIERELIAEQMALLADFDPEVRRATIGLIEKLARAAGKRFKRSDQNAQLCKSRENTRKKGS
jgi:DNA-binding MarR family transcriptional regulator